MRNIKVEREVNMIKINFPSSAKSISSKCGHRADRNSQLHLIQCSKSYYHSNRTSICSAYILINKLRNFVDEELGKEKKLWNCQKNNMWTILWQYFALHFVSHFSRFRNGILSESRICSQHDKNHFFLVWYVNFYKMWTQSWQKSQFILIQCLKSYNHPSCTSICSAYILINKLRNLADFSSLEMSNNCPDFVK